MNNGSDYSPVIKRFLRFAGVGIIGTIAHYSVLILLVEDLQVTPLAASSVGFTVGALVNYVLNYRFTFRSDRRHLDTLPRFYLVAAAGFVLNGLVMQMLAEKLGLQYIAAQVVATGIVLCWGFGVNSLWTFGRRPED